MFDYIKGMEGLFNFTVFYLRFCPRKSTPGENKNLIILTFMNHCVEHGLMDGRNEF